MSDKLLFKKRTVTKKDMEEMVCINCSTSPIDNPGILHLRYIGKTVILPERDYTIPNSSSSRQKNLQGEKEKIPREGVLIFSIARCPATVWHEGNVPVKISAGKVLFTPPGSRERLRLQNETKEKMVRYYFGVERNINLELLFNLASPGIFSSVNEEKTLLLAEELYSIAAHPASFSERDISIKLFEFLTLLIIPSNRERIFSAPYKDLFNQVAGAPGKYPCIDSLKELFHLSEKTLIKVFHTYTDRAPMEFVIFYRLYNSCWQLTESKMSIEEISRLAGYSSLSFYSKAFKKEFGLSPSEYRREHA